MRLVYFSAALIAVGFVLVGCTPAPHAPVSVPVGSKNDASGAVSINDRTPETTDSLEVPETGTGTVDTAGKLTENGTILFGAAEAPRMTEYFDYDCTYCRRFAQTDRQWINAEYVSKGKLAVDMVFTPLTPLGKRLDQAALCAAEQGKFTEMDALLLSRTPGDEKGITDAAKKLKLKTADFTACMKRTDVIPESSEAPEGRVPSFRLEGESWIGLLSGEELKKTIEEALKH